MDGVKNIEDLVLEYRNENYLLIQINNKKEDFLIILNQQRSGL